MPIQYKYGYDDLYPLLNDIRLVTKLANAIVCVPNNIKNDADEYVLVEVNIVGIPYTQTINACANAQTFTIVFRRVC